MFDSLITGIVMGIVFIPALAALISFPILMIVKWLGGDRAVWAAGIVMIGYAAYEIINILRICGADPIIVPPTCDVPGHCAGEGSAVFACDGPGGALYYGVAYLGLPAAAVCVGVLTRLVARRSRKAPGSLA